jgi:hypothetical protein
LARTDLYPATSVAEAKTLTQQLKDRLSWFLPDAEGLLRFRDIHEAVRMISLVGADYERQSRAATALAETRFDVKKVIGRVLERAL